MKPQDILFAVILTVLLSFRKPKVLYIIGIVFLFLSIPLFSKWIFFTAQRFVWYAWICFSLGIIIQLWRLQKK